jgi:hypothetical protein
MFNVDPAEALPELPTPGPNQILADQMGIVMGTSHQEPMSRNTPEWSNFGNVSWSGWTFELITKPPKLTVTVGFSRTGYLELYDQWRVSRKLLDVWS